MEGMVALGIVQGNCAIRSLVSIDLWEFRGETVGTDSIAVLD